MLIEYLETINVTVNPTLLNLLLNKMVATNAMKVVIDVKIQ